MGFCQSLFTQSMTHAAIPLSCPLTSSRGYFVLAIILNVEFKLQRLNFYKPFAYKVLFSIVSNVYQSATISISN